MWNKIDPFETKFEDVTIYFHNLQVNLFYDAVDNPNDRMSAHSSVYNFGIASHHYNKGSEVVGEVQVMFRNQGEDFNFCMFVLCDMKASSPIDNSCKSVFNKLIQYIFDWTNNYVNQNDIKDKNGKKFILPYFSYSTDRYRNIPD